jgi:hypothetical protein
LKLLIRLLIITFHEKKLGQIEPEGGIRRDSTLSPHDKLPGTPNRRAGEVKRKRNPAFGLGLIRALIPRLAKAIQCLFGVPLKAKV